MYIITQGGKESKIMFFYTVGILGGLGNLCATVLFRYHRRVCCCHWRKMESLSWLHSLRWPLLLRLQLLHSHRRKMLLLPHRPPAVAPRVPSLVLPYVPPLKCKCHTGFCSLISALISNCFGFGFVFDFGFVWVCFRFYVFRFLGREVVVE